MTAALEKIAGTERVPLAVPARIAPLANLPVFHKIEGRKAVVAGGSQGALWKAELLSAAGAQVLVLAGHGAGAKLFAELAVNPVAGSVTVLSRGWRASDLDGAVLAVADIADRQDALSFVAAARKAGAPVNVIDQTDLCDFQFGTIVNRSPVVLAISTDGGAPMLGQSIRARIESVLPLGLTSWARAAREWRPELKQRVTNFADRRGFWERFTERAWSEAGRAPTARDFDELIDGIAPERRRGSVALVGAGPGDAELLTLKAVRALQSATVILYDDLVGADVLELARREARRVAVGKNGHGPSCKQADINRQIVELAQAGERVVRLKGGDPLIFGRATEEIEACREAGVEVSIIPGISAAQGAAAALGFSLTERDKARRVQYVTGHGADGKLPADIDWQGVVDAATTTVVYMPRKTLAQFVNKALESGLTPETPAVVIIFATRPEQKQLFGPVSQIAALAESLPAGAPALVIIGHVARERAAVGTVIPFKGVAAS